MAVVGATGSGKTTLGHLLTRLYDATDGQVGWVTTDPTHGGLYHVTVPWLVGVGEWGSGGVVYLL